VPGSERVHVVQGQQFKQMGGSLFNGHNVGYQWPLHLAHKARVCMRVARLVTKHKAVLMAVRDNGGIAKGSQCTAVLSLVVQFSN